MTHSQPKPTRPLIAVAAKGVLRAILATLPPKLVAPIDDGSFRIVFAMVTHKDTTNRGALGKAKCLLCFVKIPYPGLPRHCAI